MSLMLAAVETKPALVGKIRTRITEGANVREIASVEIPAWLAAQVGDEAVTTVFESDFAAVVVLENGRTIVRRAPRH